MKRWFFVWSARITVSFVFLTLVTPVNTQAARKAFAQTNTQTQTFVATQDSQLLYNDPNGHGNTPNYYINYLTNVATGAVSSDSRLLMNFDFTGLPSTASIVSAKLDLTMSVTPTWSYALSGTTNIYAYRDPQTDWKENQASWYAYKGTSCVPVSSNTGCSYWNTLGGDSAANPPKALGVPTCQNVGCKLDFDVSDLANDAIASRQNILSMLIKYDGSINAITEYFSSEGPANKRPTITVTYTPSPPPPPCPVDITFAIDNSGSMDDHGADVTLHKLVKRLQNHLVGYGADVRGNMYSYSYTSGDSTRQGPGSGYDQTNGLATSLTDINKLTFPDDGSTSSYIGAGLKAASQYANSHIGAGRAQFIFVAGDEQPDLPAQGISAFAPMIQADAAKGIEYYSFSLRPNSLNHPYDRIASLGNGQFFANGLLSNQLGTLESLLDGDACRISGFKFNDQNGDGQRQVSDTNPGLTEPGLGGWHIRLHDVTSGTTFDTTTSTNSDNLGSYSFTGLKPSDKYWVEELPTADQKAQGWQQTSTKETAATAVSPMTQMQRNIGNAQTNCGNNCTGGVTTTKMVDPDTIKGSTFTTGVTLGVNISGQPIKSLMITEKLAANLQFARQNSPIQASYTDTNGNTSLIDLKNQPVEGQTSWQIEPSDSSVIFKPGRLSVPPIGAGGIQIKYTKTDKGQFSVDFVDPNSCTNSARVEYQNANTNGTASTQCVPFEAKSLERQNYALTINSDALFQSHNDPIVFDGDTLKVGDNALIVSGTSVSTPAGSKTLNVSNYDFPPSPLQYKTVWNKINDRINQAQKTNAHLLSVAPSGTGCALTLSGDIYLQTDGNALTSIPVNPGKPGVWILPPNCNVTLGTMTIHGSGTIVNPSGPTTVRGTVSSYGGADSLGYIAAGGDVTILDQAQPNNVAFVVNGTLNLGVQDSSVADRDTQDGAYSTFLIAQTLQFPKKGYLRNNITINSSSVVRSSVPPLLEQFTLPTSKSLQ